MPGAGDRYYLVVPYNLKDEGSYGLTSAHVERPQAAGADSRCVVAQNLTACP